MTGAPAVLPVGASRLVVFVVYDPRGEIDEHVGVALRGLRPHATHLLTVVNGELADDGRAALADLADEVLERPNHGFDVGAQRDALEHLGDRVLDYDELLLLNDTWFGPLGSFAPLFDRMDAVATDFWGLTEHAASDGYRAHLQSFWLAARRSVTASDAWASYWSGLASPETYWDAVTRHELAFTEHFAAAGFTGTAAFPATDYPVGNASVYAADLLIADGCPVLKRRPFFHDPTFLARHAVVGADLVPLVGASGYPMRAFWSNLVRTVPPRVVHADCAMIRVLPGDDAASVAPREAGPGGDGVLVVLDAGSDPRWAAPIVARMPVGFDLVITGDVDGRTVAALRGMLGVAARVVEQAPAVPGDVHGTLAVMAVLRDRMRTRVPRLVVAIPCPPATGDGAAEFRHRHAIEALLASPAHASEMLRLFDADPELGLVVPIATHVGRPFAARRWGPEREVATRLRTDGGIRVPWDDLAPLAPDDGVWAARPEAVHALFAQDPPLAGSGLAARAVLRTLAPSAAEAGLTTWSVAGNELAAVDHTALEYTMDALSSTTRGWSTDRIALLETARWPGTGDLPTLGRMWLRVHRPGAAGAVRRAADRVRGWGTVLRRRADRARG